MRKCLISTIKCFVLDKGINDETIREETRLLYWMMNSRHTKIKTNLNLYIILISLRSHCVVKRINRLAFVNTLPQYGGVGVRRPPKWQRLGQIGRWDCDCEKVLILLWWRTTKA